MKYASVAVLLALSIRICFAQIQGADSQANMSSVGSGLSMFRSFDNRFKGLEGSPLLFDEYLSGAIMMQGKIVTKPINVDATSGQLLVMHNNSEMIVNKSIVQEFSVYKGTDTLLFKKFGEGNEAKYLQELTHGIVRLYKETSKTVKQASNNGPYGIGKVNSEMETIEKFFWSANRSDLNQVKNKKTLLAEFNSNPDKVEAFIKANDISFKVENDLINLFNYLSREKF